MRKIGFGGIARIIAMFCVATVLASPAQTLRDGWRAPAYNAASKVPDFSPSGLSFAKAVTYKSGAYGAESVAVADVNGDGKPDLIVGNCGKRSGFCLGSGEVGVLLGNGDGTFQKAITYPSGGLDPLAVAVADLDGDGKPDIVILNNFSSTSSDSLVGILLGNGDGTFQPAVTYSGGGYEPITVAVADVNGDGIPDVMVDNVYHPHDKPGSVVAVLLGNGNGAFQKPVDYRLAGDPLGGAMGVSDVNGDGKPDLLVAVCANRNCATGAVDVLLGNGDGTFQTAVSYRAGRDSASIAVADVNGDGKPDLVVTNFCTDSACSRGGVSVLLGNGNGTFRAAVTYPSGGFYPIPIAVADVNSDGIPDIIVGNCGDTTRGTRECPTTHAYASILLGKGDGTFEPAVSFATGGNIPSGLAVTDLNGDGKPDIVVSNCLSNSGGTCGGSIGNVGVLLNTNTAGRAGTSTALLSYSLPGDKRIKRNVAQVRRSLEKVD